MDIVYLFRTLFKKKWLIIGLTVLAAAVAWFFTRSTIKNYKSSTQISTGFTISDNIRLGNNNFDLFEADTKFNNTIITITSPTVINLLAYKLIVHDLSSANPYRQLNEKQKQSPVYKNINQSEAAKIFSERLENINLLTSYKPEERKLLEFLSLYGYDYKSLLKSLSVYRLQRTDYIQMDFVSENPELSSFIVNELFTEFIDYYRKTRSTTSKESVDTLRSFMEKKKQDLDFKRAMLRGAGVAGAEMESTSTYDLISNLEQTLATEKTLLTTLQASLRKVNLRLSNLAASSSVVTPPVNTAGDNDEIILLRNEMNEAYKKYLAGGSTDARLLARYNQLKREYQAKVSVTTIPEKEVVTERLPETKTELQNKKNDLEIDIQTSNENINSLQSKISALRGNASSNASREATAESLMKEEEQANIEYLAARKKYDDALETSSSSANNFRQVLRGQPAIAPEPSKKLMMVGMAGASAMIVSTLVILFLAYLDSSVKTPTIFSKAVNLKLLNMVGLMNFKKSSIVDMISSKELLKNGAVDRSTLNSFREALRKLRYEVESSKKRIFLFASTKKGQGKTTLITGLSYSLSLSNKKVLIIDTNFCNNDLTQDLGGTPSLELFSYDETRPLLEQVKEKAKDTGDGKVFIIGSEAGDFTPSEILPENNILKHLHSLLPAFDYIFLEGPPLNDFSDAKELSQYVDGVIGIFSATDSIKQADKDSIAFFKSLGDKYIGSVLNKVDTASVNAS
jgi:polysaccharide biosynthesis transport protein